MGRGGRSGGGGRSVGGGSFRSSGGRMHSSGRGGRSSMGSGSPGSGLDGFRPRPYYRGYYYGHRGRRGGSILPFFVCLILMLFLFRIICFDGGRYLNSNSITKSTVAREPLEASAVIRTGYLTDELDWIRSSTKLRAGMEQFFKETGVQPYLYITDTVNGTHEPASEDMDIYANQLYEDLFQDEGHILILFHEYYPTQYHTWYVCGKQAKTVMDQEACDILLDYIDYYYYSDLADDEMFSTVFEKAGKRIMTVSKSPLPVIVVAVCAVLVAAIGFFWWKKAKEQKNIEAEQTRQILSANLETIGEQQQDSELADLESKYKE